MECKECNGEGLLGSGEGMSKLCPTCKGTGHVRKVQCAMCDNKCTSGICRNCAVHNTLVIYPDKGITVVKKSRLPEWVKARGDVVYITHKDMPMLMGEAKINLNKEN